MVSKQEESDVLGEEQTDKQIKVDYKIESVIGK